jgi:phosphate transport system protein
MAPDNEDVSHRDFIGENESLPPPVWGGAVSADISILFISPVTTVQRRTTRRCRRVLYLTRDSKARHSCASPNPAVTTNASTDFKPGRSRRNAMNHDPRHFAAQLEELKASVLTMGGLAEERLRVALRALIDRNHVVLADVVSGDSRINKLQIEIDDRCFKLFALYQPVAVDLRTIVSALKINDDLERVGDLVVNLGEAAQRYLLHPPVKPLIDLPRMGELALKMLREALDAFVSKDVSAARRVLMEDDWLDALKDQILRELLTFMLGDSRTIEPGMDLILMSRHLERVGDHATNIAEDVIFIVEARDVRHRRTMPVTVERRNTSDTAPV